MTQFTPNYNIPLYEGADKPDLTDQYNDAMGIVDAQLHAGAGDVGELTGRVNTLNQSIATITGQITELTGELNTLTGEAATINAELAALGITDVATSQALLAEINGHGTTLAQHTQEISDVMGDVSKIEADYFDCTGLWTTQQTNIESKSGAITGQIFTAVNNNKTVLKVYGYFSTQANAAPSSDFVTVPGSNDTGLATTIKIDGWQGGTRSFICTGYYVDGLTDTTTGMQGSFTNFQITNDGTLYLLTAGIPLSQRGMSPYSRGFFPQTPYMVPGSWPQDANE